MCGAWQATRRSEGLKEKKEELELSIRDGTLAVFRKVCQANESRHVWKEASSGEDMEDKDSFGTLCYRTYRGHVFFMPTTFLAALFQVLHLNTLLRFSIIPWSMYNTLFSNVSPKTPSSTYM